MLPKFWQHLARERLDFRVLSVAGSFFKFVDGVFMRVNHLVDIGLVEIAAALLAQPRYRSLIIIVLREVGQTFARREAGEFGRRLRMIGHELLGEAANFRV